MTEQLADGVEIITLVKKMCGEAVTKRVETALLSGAGFFLLHRELMKQNYK
jgi:hypothetical protein